MMLRSFGSIWLASSLLVAHASVTTPAAVLSPQQQAAADTCLQYVSFRLGHMLSLKINQVAEPKPPASLWLVVGEDRQQTKPISFVCHLTYQNAQWSLEKLELLQLNSETLPAPTPSADDQGAPAS
ncbi:hypothetical protein ACFOSS_13135 [Pseudaeromonas sharmana]|uniref:Uncharacterized protein n=1 Tax=Pseudaeromonas sharmana TaxID=328412 RepID=A0ABV8CQF9_9GAMM